MKRRLAFTLLTSLLLVLTAFSQSPVQQTLRTLDSLTLSAFDDWKMSPDLASWKPDGDPSQPGYDDSKWVNLKLNESVYPDSCWLRKTITLPKAVFGSPISGPVVFSLSVDDYGYLWVNGKAFGHFPWDGEFQITPDARPGEQFTLAVKAVNTGGPLRLIRAEIQMKANEQIRQTVDDIKLSLRVGEKLLSFDTYQTNSNVRTDPGIDKSSIPKDQRTKLNQLLQESVSLFNYDALSNGPQADFMASVEAWKRKVQPVSDFVKGFTLQFSSNAHIDAAWLWREQETIEVCHHTFNSANNIMDAKTDATYEQSAAAYYKWMEELYPDTFDRIKKRVKEGRWEVVGGMWVEPDCNLPSGDSWARHLLYAKSYFKNKLGADVTIGWNPDSFGYNGNMPMLYKEAGIDAFITQKIGWNDTDVFPYRLFWWESQDGSKILSIFPFDYVNDIKNPFRLVDWARQYEANTGFRNMLVLFGIGNHGGGPSLEMMLRIDRLKNIPIYPTVKFGTAGEYVSWLKSQDLTTLPVWDDELYLEYHRGTYTTQAAMKKFNRESENLLTGTETFSTFATEYKKPYPADALRTAWEKVMFNQFHDILPGSGIREVYIDATRHYNEAEGIARFEREESLDKLAGEINTSRMPKGEPIVVYNQLSWPRSEVVHFALPQGDTSPVAVFAADGKEIPSQVRTTGYMTREVMFLASEVPAFGYSTYLLRPQTPKTSSSSLSISTTALENEFYKVSVDPESGWVKSIIEKKTGKEILTGAGNELQILEDKPKAWDAWNIGLTGVTYPSKFTKFEIVDKGPVSVTLRLYRTYLKPGVTRDFPTEDFPTSFFQQDITLSAGIPRVDFTTHADWWEDKTMVKVAFPVAVTDSEATYEIPYGTIERSTKNETSFQKAQFEVPSHRWADLSDNNLGVVLLNRSKYGYDVKGNVMRLSLLRSPKWPDPTADRGMHSIDYAVTTHSGKDIQKTVRQGYEYNSPLLAVGTGRHKGTLGTSGSFVTVSNPDLIVTAVKKAENSDAWILTGYNPTDGPLSATITYPGAIKTASYSNVMEEAGQKIAAKGKSVEVKVKKRGMVVVRTEMR